MLGCPAEYFFAPQRTQRSQSKKVYNKKQKTSRLKFKRICYIIVDERGITMDIQTGKQGDKIRELFKLLDNRDTISPMVDEKARKVAGELGIKIYSYADEIPPEILT
jgi:hypothetical protein